MPLAARKRGRIWPKSPESWVEVVEESVMKRSCALASRVRSAASRKARILIICTALFAAWIMHKHSTAECPQNSPALSAIPHTCLSSLNADSALRPPRLRIIHPSRTRGRRRWKDSANSHTARRHMLQQSPARARAPDIDWRLLAPLLANSVIVQATIGILRVTTSYRTLELGLPVIWLGVISASFA